MADSEIIVIAGKEIINIGVALGAGVFIGFLVAACIALAGAFAFELLWRGIGWGCKSLTPNDPLEGK